MAASGILRFLRLILVFCRTLLLSLRPFLPTEHSSPLSYSKVDPNSFDFWTAQSVSLNPTVFTWLRFLPGPHPHDNLIPLSHSPIPRSTSDTTRWEGERGEEKALNPLSLSASVVVGVTEFVFPHPKAVYQIPLFVSATPPSRRVM